MIKKYSFADGEIYHGEAMRVLIDLPDNSVDAVLTDPPYCSGAFTLMGKQQGAHNKYQSTGAQAVYSDFVGDCRYSAPRGNNRVHLTQKPVELIKDLLKITCPGDVVLDPFLGSGTTAVACHEMWRHFVGCEITEDNIKITIDRLNIPSQVSLLEVM